MNEDKFRLAIVILLATFIVTLWVGMLIGIAGRRSASLSGRRISPLSRTALPRQIKRPTLPKPRPTTRPKQPAQTVPEAKK